VTIRPSLPYIVVTWHVIWSHRQIPSTLFRTILLYCSSFWLLSSLDLRERERHTKEEYPKIAILILIRYTSH